MDYILVQAGGKGTRLGLKDIPKPMVKIGDKPLLEHQIEFAKRYGIDFEPIPLFPNQPEAGIYSKVSWNVDILPYRLIWAITALIFEKNIYKELYWLYKMKKKKKQNN